jgi:uncharacterized protein DUF2383
LKRTDSVRRDCAFSPAGPGRKVLEGETWLRARRGPSVLDAIEAYEAAILRLSDAGDKAELGRFMADHRRHVTELTPLVLEIGGKAATSPDFKRVLTKGKVLVMAIAGDSGVLEAMRSNEETTTKVYDKARNHPDLPMEARTIMERNFADEQRHLAWLQQRLSGLHRDKKKEGVRHT